MTQEQREVRRIHPLYYDEKQKQIMGQVQDIKHLLHLAHWQIHLLQGEPPDPSCICSILPQPGYQEAGIFLRSDFSELPEAELTHAIVHELVHLHFERACSALDLGVQVIESDPNTQGALEQIGMNHHLGIEQGVEGLARVITPMLSTEKAVRKVSHHIRKALGILSKSDSEHPLDFIEKTTQRSALREVRAAERLLLTYEWAVSHSDQEVHYSLLADLDADTEAPGPENNGSKIIGEIEKMVLLAGDLLAPAYELAKREIMHAIPSRNVDAANGIAEAKAMLQKIITVIRESGETP